MSEFARKNSQRANEWAMKRKERLEKAKRLKEQRKSRQTGNSYGGQGNLTPHLPIPYK